MTQDPINVFDELQRLTAERARYLAQQTQNKHEMDTLTTIKKQHDEKNSAIIELIDTVERKITETAKLLNK